MMKYLTRAKKPKDQILPMSFLQVKHLFQLNQISETKDAINRFVRDNPRTEKAGGGMLVR